MIDLMCKSTLKLTLQHNCHLSYTFILTFTTCVACSVSGTGILRSTALHRKKMSFQKRYQQIVLLQASLKIFLWIKVKLFKCNSKWTCLEDILTLGNIYNNLKIVHTSIGQGSKNLIWVLFYVFEYLMHSLIFEIITVD